MTPKERHFHCNRFTKQFFFSPMDSIPQHSIKILIINTAPDSDLDTATRPDIKLGHTSCCDRVNHDHCESCLLSTPTALIINHGVTVNHIDKIPPPSTPAGPCGVGFRSSVSWAFSIRFGMLL